MMSEQSARVVKYEHLCRRLEMLELWRELAIRPKREECVEDSDFWDREEDDVQELTERCLLVRELMNDNLLPVEEAQDRHLKAIKSGIPDAGLGLFFDPEEVSNDSEDETSIEAGTILCYYTGHIHNYHSAKGLKDRSYLMLVDGGILVDPGPLPQIKARYINDPLNEIFVNCKFVPVPDKLRSAVVATRTITRGEELFVSYGDGYWAQHETLGRSI
jgi:predicted transcriptional regulator